MSFALFVKRNTKIDGVPLYLFGVRTVMEKMIRPSVWAQGCGVCICLGRKCLITSEASMTAVHGSLSISVNS